MTAIAVVAGKAAPGATTVATALALAAQEPVLLVDADPAGGDVVPGLLPGRASTDTGLLSWLVATRHMTAMDATAVLAEHALTLPEAGDVWVLPGLQAPAQAGLLVSGGWSRLATTVERCGPVLERTVIVDAGRLSDSIGWPVVDACDIVLLVVRPTARSVQAAAAATQLLRVRLGDLDRVRLVVNGAGPVRPRPGPRGPGGRARRPGGPAPGRPPCSGEPGRRGAGHRVRAAPHPATAGGRSPGRPDQYPGRLVDDRRAGTGRAGGVMSERTHPRGHDPSDVPDFDGGGASPLTSPSASRQPAGRRPRTADSRGR